MDLCVSGRQTPDGLKESCYFLVKFWQAQASARRAWRRGGVPLETVRSARKKCSFLFFFFSAFLLSGVVCYLRFYYSCPRSSKLKLTCRGTFVSVLLNWRKQQLVCGGSLARDLIHTHNSGGKIPR